MSSWFARGRVALAGLAAITALALAGCGSYSEDIYQTDYLAAAGINADHTYTLVAAPELTEQTKGTIEGDGWMFLSAGSVELKGEFAIVESVRFAVKVNDSRVGAEVTVIVDIPMGKVSWIQKAGATTPQARFTLKTDPVRLYVMGDEDESLWSYNENNTTKNEAIDTFNASASELFASFATRVVITVTPQVFEQQVLPLQRGKTG